MLKYTKFGRDSPFKIWHDNMTKIIFFTNLVFNYYYYYYKAFL